MSYASFFLSALREKGSDNRKLSVFGDITVSAIAQLVESGDILCLYHFTIPYIWYISLCQCSTCRKQWHHLFLSQRKFVCSDILCFCHSATPYVVAFSVSVTAQLIKWWHSVFPSQHNYLCGDILCLSHRNYLCGDILFLCHNTPFCVDMLFL